MDSPNSVFQILTMDRIESLSHEFTPVKDIQVKVILSKKNTWNFRVYETQKRGRREDMEEIKQNTFIRIHSSLAYSIEMIGQLYCRYS